MGSSKSSSSTKWKPNTYQKQILSGMVDQYNDSYLPMANRLGSEALSQREGLASQTIDYNSLLNSANSQVAAGQQGIANLVNGEIPQIFLNNISDALTRTNEEVTGSAVNSLANRGIINSSVTNKALGDIADSNANAITQNMSNYMNQLSDLYNNQISNAGAQIGLAGTAQGNAQTAASNSLTDSLNAYNAASGILGTGGSQTTSSNSGGNSWLNGLIGVGAALCFTGDTKVYTEKGDKNIKDVKVGDKVCCLDDYDRICYQTVTEVQEPFDQEVWEVIAEKDGKRYKVKTTLSQPFMTEDGFYEELGLMKLNTVLARVGRVVEFRRMGVAPVYDIKVAAYNNYLANGFVAYGMFK